MDRQRNPYYDVEFMSPKERLNRIIELLAVASIRLIEEQKSIVSKLPSSVLSDLINRSNEGSQ